MTKTPEDEKKKAGEKAYIIERGRDEKTGIVYDRAIREIEQPPEDNITPFKEALRTLSKELKKTGESVTEAAKAAAGDTSGINAALEQIKKTIPAAMEQITALTSEVKASEEFKRAQEIAELEIRFRNRELKKKFYKEAMLKLSEKEHEKLLEQASPEELKEFKKEFYKAPSWDNVMNEHREAIQAASDTEIALSTREDGSVIIAGTMYEHYKNAWRDYYNLYLEAKRNVIEAPARHNKRIFFPIAQAFNNAFPLSNPKNKDNISFEFDGASEEDRQNKRKVVTLVNIDFSDLPFHLTKELTSFDGDIFSACFTLCLEEAKKNGGGERDLFPCVTTIKELHETLGQELGGNQQKNFVGSLDKLDRVRILIDNSQEIENGYKYSNTSRNGWAHVLNVEYIPTIIQNQKGQKENIEALYIQPTALMNYIASRGQFIPVSREFFSLSEGVFNKNDRARSVRNYIIKAIHTQTKTAGAITILFETLCKKCYISRKANLHQEDRITKNVIEPLLKAYKNGGLIEKYTIKPKEKITIQVEPAPKLEAKKKPPKGNGDKST